ncbi:TetR/AcrR family transcriptional regulator [Rhodococcus sovatensis]|uniref:TetR/AcrR family transcriptional regulator n=1 Tax=Rhodococcus sovatensis TaxID=1805840 RepID=A0ABZ2PLR6_9NOCA
MARSSDQTKRAKLLDDIVDYVREHGVSDLSLRPLAAGLGTSSRMLLYYFGTKEELLKEVLLRASNVDLGENWMREVTDVNGLRLHLWLFWKAASVTEMSGSRLFVEMVGLASVGEGVYREIASAGIASVAESIAEAMIRCGCGRDRALANGTLAISGLRGLFEDRLINDAFERTESSAEKLIDFLVRDVEAAIAENKELL